MTTPSRPGPDWPELPPPSPERSHLSHLVHGLRGVGTEPDPRFTLANERTYLAWVLTSLALIAGGVALRSLRPVSMSIERSHAISIVLIVSGVLLSWSSLGRWLSVELALRRGRPLPFPGLFFVVATALTITSAAILWSTLR